MTLIYNATFDKNTRKLSFEDKAGNEIYSFIVPERAPTVNDITKPLTFKATQDGSTVNLRGNGSPSGAFQTSRDGGNTWTDYTIGTDITLNIGEKVSFRAKEDRTEAQMLSKTFEFSMTGKIEAWHNVMSLYRKEDFATYDTTLEYAFYGMFEGCTSLVKAPVLPATTLAQYCYNNMFRGCASLVNAPELPATTLAQYCYQYMFDGCTSLTEAPVLPATTLAQYCYSGMFRGCASLVNAPELPATTLDQYCYYNMFDGCRSLAEAPVLPATTLAQSCYSGMFRGCASLVNAPELPATTLADSCYNNMFRGCASLVNAPELPATTLADSCYGYMFQGCTSLVNAPGLPATTLADSCYGYIFQGCTSLVNAPELPATTLAQYCYQYMFDGCTSLTRTPELKATTLADYCCQYMFKGCTSLTEAPALPATTPAQYCCSNMFEGCTSLMNAPELPATTLAQYCYQYMFKGCTSLVNAPALPATTLDTRCYYYMFEGCTSLVNAPELPATKLASYCYGYMFKGCTSLVNAPALPATTLTINCYRGMFNGCTSLTRTTELKATTLAQYCYYNMFEGCGRLNEVRCNIPSSYSERLISSTYAKSWLSGVSSTGTFYTNADANWPSGANGIPEGWNRVAVDAVTKPLTFRATQDGSTVKLTKTGSPTGAFQTSNDGGNTWVDYTDGTAITLNTGEEVSFRAKSDRTSTQTLDNYFYFEMTGQIEAWHNVMSLYRTNDFATFKALVKYAFHHMFYGCTSLTKVPELPATSLAQRCYLSMFEGCTSLTESPALPATTLANYCYASMFKSCTSLTKAPELPATTLANYCYYGMFSGCTSLTEAPALPATTLTEDCYIDMFKGCTSLKKAPELPATSLANNCYESMFQGCTSLTKAPELPANKLAEGCYLSMFEGCTSLVNAPELPATSLVIYCYVGMFYGCRSLNEVRCNMPSSYSAEDIPRYTDIGFSFSRPWLDGVSPTGTFYTNADANWPSGASGIPTGWTRVNEGAPTVDDITKPLTFKATQDGSTVTLKKNGSPSVDLFQTSRDGGNTWSDYTDGTAITLNTGEEVSFRAKADRTSAQDYQNYFYFEMTGQIEAWHNVMSLYRTNDFATYNTVVGYAFSYMFRDCTSLTKAPVLPATTLADSCCKFMFDGCTSLTEAPTLPATTLASYCYTRMFDGCIGLTKAPVLPATTLASRCYQFMFNGCTSLIKAPELPATTLDISCYQSMFNGCTSLKKSPELPATTLAGSCYFNMFDGCSSLNEVHCKIPSSYSSSQISSYARDWLLNVSSTGTFYTNEDADWPSDSPSGIPTGWTRIPKPAPVVSDIKKPLTFRATQNGSTVTLKKYGRPEGASFQTSRDDGNTWEDYTIDTAISLNTGDEVSFRAKADRTFAQSTEHYFQFNMTGKIEARHNVMSLYRTNDFATYESVMEYAFYRLFRDCTSLTKAPRLPATTLTTDCYRDMFRGCTSLTEAPYLPATSLAQYCYKSMFLGCTSLTEVPVLQATRLGTRCYWQMFEGCSSLNEVHCYIPSSYSTEVMSAHADGWLYGVASTGTFHTNADANWSSGASGIPDGWTRDT